MAILSGDLWQFNLAKVVVIDVSDDYCHMQAPLPSSFYPILEERWLPAYQLGDDFCEQNFRPGYLYDWHETPECEGGSWYVGLVRQDLASSDPA